MFLLDTNVISELRRLDRADRNVVAWANALPAASFFLSVISVLEIELGALLIARKDAAQGAVLRAWIDDQILPASRAASSPSIQPWRCVARVFMVPIRARNVML